MVNPLELEELGSGSELVEDNGPIELERSLFSTAMVSPLGIGSESGVVDGDDARDPDFTCFSFSARELECTAFSFVSLSSLRVGFLLGSFTAFFFFGWMRLTPTT